MRAIQKFDKLELFKMLFAIMQPLISQNNTKELSEFERYNKEVLISASNILECLDQINYSIDLLSGYNQKTTTINRHDYIMFMLENFYLRLTSIIDRTFRFTNIAFELGLPDRECKDSTIIKNENVKKTKVYDALKEIDSYIGNYRQQRNKIAHFESFRDSELMHVEAFYLLIESGNTDLVEHKQLFKTEVDGYIKLKKDELNQISNNLEKLLIHFFNEIHFVVKTIGAKYEEK